MGKLVDPEGLSSPGLGSWSDRRNGRRCPNLTGGATPLFNSKDFESRLANRAQKEIFEECQSLPGTPPGCSIALKDLRLWRKGYVLIQREHWSRAARVA